MAQVGLGRLDPVVPRHDVRTSVESDRRRLRASVRPGSLELRVVGHRPVRAPGAPAIGGTVLALELSGPLARPVMVAMGQPGALAETMIDRVLLDREPKAAPAPTSVVTTIAHSDPDQTVVPAPPSEEMTTVQEHRGLVLAANAPLARPVMVAMGQPGALAVMTIAHSDPVPMVAPVVRVQVRAPMGCRAPTSVVTMIALNGLGQKVQVVQPPVVTAIVRSRQDPGPKAVLAPTSVVTTIAHSALAGMIVSVENAHLSAPCRRAGEALPVAAPSKSIDPTKKQAILASCSLALQSRVRPSRTSGCGSTSGHRSVLV